MLNQFIHCKAENFTDIFVESFKRTLWPGMATG